MCTYWTQLDTYETQLPNARYCFNTYFSYLYAPFSEVCFFCFLHKNDFVDSRTSQKLISAWARMKDAYTFNCLTDVLHFVAIETLYCQLLFRYTVRGVVIFFKKDEYHFILEAIISQCFKSLYVVTSYVVVFQMHDYSTNFSCDFFVSDFKVAGH